MGLNDGYRLKTKYKKGVQSIQIMNVLFKMSMNGEEPATPGISY